MEKMVELILFRSHSLIKQEDRGFFCSSQLFFLFNSLEILEFELVGLSSSNLKIIKTPNIKVPFSVLFFVSPRF